jgi:hypothetical protein
MRHKTLFVALALLVMWIASPAMAGKNKYQSVMTETEVSTAGGAVSATISNPNNSTGYLVVKTANEAATASLVVTVYNVAASGDILVCTMTAITTDTTTVALLGSTLTAADGITDACDFPMADRVKYTFTVSGLDADFDVTADMHWISDG